jgi:hypothetical protein
VVGRCRQRVADGLAVLRGLGRGVAGSGVAVRRLVSVAATAAGGKHARNTYDQPAAPGHVGFSSEAFAVALSMHGEPSGCETTGRLPSRQTSSEITASISWVVGSIW